MKTIYLVDSENVSDSWLNLLEQIRPEDQILVFYTDKSPHMSYANLIHLKQSEFQPEFLYCRNGTENALDFQLVTYLGYLLKENSDTSLVVVSKDKGFDCIVHFWTERGYHVSRIDPRKRFPESRKPVPFSQDRPGQRAAGQRTTEQRAAEQRAAKQRTAEPKTAEPREAKPFMNPPELPKVAAAAENDAVSSENRAGNHPVFSDMDKTVAKQNAGGSKPKAAKDTENSMPKTAKDTENSTPKTAKDVRTNTSKAAEATQDTENHTAEAAQGIENNAAEAAQGIESNAAEIAQNTEENPFIRENLDWELPFPSVDPVPERTAVSAEEKGPVEYDDGEVATLISCIGLKDLASLHNIFVSIYGMEKGSYIYNVVKKSSSEIKKVNWQKKTKFKKFISILFANSNISLQDDFIKKLYTQKENLKGVHNLFVSIFGQKKGSEYYKIYKPHADFLKNTF